MIIKKFSDIDKINNNTKILFIKKCRDFENSKPLPFLEKLKELTIKGNYDESLDNLENTVLTRLYIDGKFNNKLDKLPITLKYLTIIGDFSHELNNLPNFLEILQISCRFNNNLDNLPNQLKKLKITCYTNYNRPLDFLPNSLIIFILDSLSFNHLLDNLPSSLEYCKISFDKNYFEKFPNLKKNLPKKIKTLYLNYY